MTLYYRAVRHSFSEPHLAFSIGVLPTFPWSYWCENYTRFWKRIEAVVECDFQSNWDTKKNWKSVKREFCTNKIWYKKADKSCEYFIKTVIPGFCNTPFSRVRAIHKSIRKKNNHILKYENDEKSKTTATLIQRDIFKTIFRLARPAFFRFRCY